MINKNQVEKIYNNLKDILSEDKKNYTYLRYLDNSNDILILINKNIQNDGDSVRFHIESSLYYIAIGNNIILNFIEDQDIDIEYMYANITNLIMKLKNNLVSLEEYSFFGIHTYSINGLDSPYYQRTYRLSDLLVMRFGKRVRTDILTLRKLDR